jgi:hypothetical protein
MCIWCGGVLAGAIVVALHGSPAAVIPVLMLAFGLTLGYRLLRMSVTLGPEDLLVRNYFQTRRVSRAEVEGFRIGSVSTQPFRRTIYLLLGDGSVLPLDVAGRANFSGRGKAVLAERMRVLQRWFDSR